MSALFTAANLLYTGYKTTARPGDDLRITGKPDSTLLNKSEAYEMAYFIDRYMRSKTWKQISTGQKIEAFIQSSARVHLSHAEWIAELNSNFKVNG